MTEFDAKHAVHELLDVLTVLIAAAPSPSQYKDLLMADGWTLDDAMVARDTLDAVLVEAYDLMREIMQAVSH